MNNISPQAYVDPKAKIGNNVTIGANSALMTPAKDGHTYLGCPAKKVF